MVAMGGADAAGLTVKVARALRLVDDLDRVDFVTGSAFPHGQALAEVLEGAPWRAVVHRALPNLVERYCEADLCVVAGGLTMWETCCVGAPALAVCQPIDHQLELAARLAAAGAMATVGYGLDAPIEAIAEAVRALRSPDARRAMAEAGPALIDGQGAQRVAQAFLDTARRSR
jgi:spore coat polysaccharide biosynthesis predicted glycosyltransferase SpsG